MPLKQQTQRKTKISETKTRAELINATQLAAQAYTALRSQGLDADHPDCRAAHDAFCTALSAERKVNPLWNEAMQEATEKNKPALNNKPCLNNKSSLTQLDRAMQTPPRCVGEKQKPATGKRRLNLVCPVCQVDFIAGPLAVYCSEECKGKGKRARERAARDGAKAASRPKPPLVKTLTCMACQNEFDSVFADALYCPDCRGKKVGS